ncbi:MAG TPA: exonuclease domain-containing protein [Azospirillaceae bacterium]|nr:exonuclease domain-containing protein [Azospirillaceae bacterium]
MPFPTAPPPGRFVALDVEMTGNPPVDGRCIVELGAVEIVDGRLTGAEWVSRFDPQAPINPIASGIHGIRQADLAGCPLFADKVDELLRFIDGAPLVMHGASGDLHALHVELAALGRPRLASPVICTVKCAQRHWPGERARLNDLAARVGLDLGGRGRRRGHGALGDARLTALIWLAMGGPVPEQPRPRRRRRRGSAPGGGDGA